MLLQALGKASPIVTLLVFQYSVRIILSLFRYRIPLFFSCGSQGALFFSD